MKATFATLLLSLAPALPTISGLPSEKRQTDGSDRVNFPINISCSNFTITDSGILESKDCEGNPKTFDLNTCVGSRDGELTFNSQGFSDSCNHCFILNDSQLKCNCAASGFRSSLNILDCQFLRYDGIHGNITCSDLKKKCPNPEQLQGP